MIPKLSVVIPFYNVRAQMERCLVSLFAQSMVDDMEFVFVDDFSDDGSLESLRESLSRFCLSRENVIIIENKKRGGVAEARNSALGRIRGRFFAFCDADDFVESDMYERLVSVLEEDNADMAYCGMKAENADGSVCELRPIPRTTAAELIAHDLPSRLFNSPCNKVYRTSFLVEHGIAFRTDATVGSDMLFNVDFLLKSPRIVCCGFSPYLYRYNGTSISHARTIADGKTIVGFVDILFPLLNGAHFSDARDRLCRNALLASIRYKIGGTREWRTLRSRLSGRLTSDDRYGLGKKFLLLLADVSYPFACWLASLFMRAR